MVAVDVFPESLAVGVCNLSVSDNNSIRRVWTFLQGSKRDSSSPMRMRKISVPLCTTALPEYHLIFNPTKTLCESRIRALILGYRKAASANCATGCCWQNAC